MVQTNRYAILDLLKGVGIIFVIITHSAWGNDERLMLFFPYSIAMAVPVFMMISGFVYAKSFQRNEIVCFANAYKINAIYKHVVRFAVPFTAAFLLEETIKLVRGGGTHDFLSTTMRYLSGGEGPGSYYFPVMIQFVFVFPIIYFIIYTFKMHGLAICFFMNVSFEILKSAYQMNEECYRLLIFRYIIFIAVGAYLAMNQQSVKLKWRISSLLIGIFFVWLFNYAPYQPYIIVFWKGTCFLVAFYIAPIFEWVIRKIHVRMKVLEDIGKASFNIFLTQMVYYNFGGIPLMRGRAIQLIANVLICCAVGLVFHWIEAPITRYIVRFGDEKLKAHVF